MTGTGFAEAVGSTVMLAGRRFVFRRARRQDLPALVALLRDDVLGSTREQSSDEDPAAYQRAFDLIDADPNQLLVSVEESTSDAATSARIVGTLQLTLIPGLSRRGTTRLQIEAVRIGRAAQGIGLGSAVFAWAHDCGRAAGAGLAQLTTDKSRTDAHRFYDRLGYVPSHDGLKLDLGSRDG